MCRGGTVGGGDTGQSDAEDISDVFSGRNKTEKDC